MRALLLLALALTACAPPSGWHVIGGTVQQQADSLTLIDSARQVSGRDLPEGYVAIVPPGSLDGWCGVPGPTYGCCYSTGVEVVATPDQAMTTTALAHELCHFAVSAAHGPAFDSCMAALAQHGGK
jgi:hypothetical protein